VCNLLFPGGDPGGVDVRSEGDDSARECRYPGPPMEDMNPPPPLEEMNMNRPLEDPGDD
jgi:hypothetical protein